MSLDGQVRLVRMLEALQERCLQLDLDSYLIKRACEDLNVDTQVKEKLNDLEWAQAEVNKFIDRCKAERAVLDQCSLEELAQQVDHTLDHVESRRQEAIEEASGGTAYFIPFGGHAA